MTGNIKFWTSHVAALRREGVAVSVYARQHGLARSSLYQWRRKLNSDAGDGAAGAASGKFVALRLIDSAAPVSSAHCTLLLASELRLEMTALPPPAWLAALEQARSGVS